MTNRLNHLAIIPDGNRRWAKLNNINLVDAYIFSCDQVFEICIDLYNNLDSLNELSLFFVSKENLKVRTKNDLDALFISGNYFIQKYASRICNYNIKLNWVGIEHNSPKEINSDIFENFLKNVNSCPIISNPLKTLNILIGYDIMKDINNAIGLNGIFSIENLAVKSKIDLIIRTGGCKRLSGFLPLNCLYSEFAFIDKLFPNTLIGDIYDSIGKYKDELQNFGK